MSSINIENDQFVMIDDNNNKTVLLKVFEPLSNYSSLPMHEVNNDGSVRYMLLDDLEALANDFDMVSEGVIGGPDKLTVLLISLLVTKELFKKHRDVKVLEIGCDKGVLSYYLAKLLKRFNQSNKLICVTDVMGDNCDNWWFNKILLSDAGEIVSLVTTEYNNMLFPRDYFDIVIVNGSVQFGEPGEVICNAVNAVKHNGLLISFSNSQYLLSSCFQVFVEDYTEYTLSKTSSVLTKEIDEEEKLSAYKRTDEYKISALKQNTVKELAALKETIEHLGDDDYIKSKNDFLIDDKIKSLIRAEDDVLKVFSYLNSSDIKFNINELKESLISYRISGSAEEREYFAKVCGQRYQTVLRDMEENSDFIINHIGGGGVT